MTSLHVICDLGLPQSKILATPMNWRSPKKLFCRTFFWRTLTAVSLVLGLEHSCPWPREGLSSERLSLASDFFFCVLGFGLEPCFLNFNSGILSPVTTKQQSSLKHHVRKLALKATLTIHQLPIIAQVTFTQNLETGDKLHFWQSELF